MEGDRVWELLGDIERRVSLLEKDQQLLRRELEVKAASPIPVPKKVGFGSRLVKGLGKVGDGLAGVDVGRIERGLGAIASFGPDKSEESPVKKVGKGGL